MTTPTLGWRPQTPSSLLVWWMDRARGRTLLLGVLLAVVSSCWTRWDPGPHSAEYCIKHTFGAAAPTLSLLDLSQTPRFLCKTPQNSPALFPLPVGAVAQHALLRASPAAHVCRNKLPQKFRNVTFWNTSSPGQAAVPSQQGAPGVLPTTQVHL